VEYIARSSDCRTIARLAPPSFGCHLLARTFTKTVELGELGLRQTVENQRAPAFSAIRFRFSPEGTSPPPSDSVLCGISHRLIE
jgi:hypothetical protein